MTCLARVLFYGRNTSGGLKADPMMNSLLSSCGQQDRSSGLTGSIFFNEQYFLQGMEGSRLELSRKLATVMMDTRISDVTLMSFTAIDARKFLGWLVAYAAPAEELQSIYLQFGTSLTFNPGQLSHDNAEALLAALWLVKSRYVIRTGLEPAGQRKPAVEIAKPDRPTASLSPPRDTFVPTPMAMSRTIIRS